MNKNRETLMKFISAQNQKVQDDISKQGYKDNSPYRDNPFNIIQGTPQGTSITMDGVSKRLYATDGQTSKILEPNSGTHFFSGPQVKEIALAKYGGLLNKTIKCSNCGWSWKAADGGSDVMDCHKCGGKGLIKAQKGLQTTIKKNEEEGTEYFNQVKDWYNKYTNSPGYKENLIKSGYEDPQAIIDRRLSNINNTKFKHRENRLGSYYNNKSNKIHYSPIKDQMNFPGDGPDAILAHEVGHSSIDIGDGFFQGFKPNYNKYDYEQLKKRNKNPKISRGPHENYADQKALQYEAEKQGLYKAGYDEFTKEILDKLDYSDLKERALRNYSEEDLIWLLNNIAQTDNNKYELPIAQEGVETQEGTEAQKQSVEDARKYMEEYMNSPMYKDMLKNSLDTQEEYDNMRQLRNKNLNSAEVVFLKKNDPEFPNVLATSNSFDGRIEMFPRYKGPTKYDNTYMHELSHSVDRPYRENSDKLTFEEFMKKRPRLIPAKDINLIDTYRKSTTAYHNLYDKNLNNWKFDEDRNTNEYISDPTETRARLNELRYIGKKNNIYDPFTQKVTPEIFKKLGRKSFFEHLTDVDGIPALDDLREIYTDDQIINLLNTVSQNDKRDDQSPIAFAQMGGAGMMYADRSYQVGGQKKPIYVESENDSRYKAYNDSLFLYKTSLKNMWAEKNRSKSKVTKKGFIPFDEFNTFVPGSNLEYNDENRYPGESFEAWKKKSTVVSKTKLNNLIKNNIKPIGFDINEWKSDVKGKPTLNYSTVYKKPEQEVIVQRPEIESLQSLTPLQAVGTQIEASLPVIRPEAQTPKSYDVSTVFNSMKGPTTGMRFDRKPFNRKEATLEQAMQILEYADKYNANIQEKYGPESELSRRSSRIAEMAADRANKIKLEVSVTPNYQVGGENMYTVSGDQPLIIPSQGSYPFDYNNNLPVNEAGMPYITEKDGKKILLSSARKVPTKDEFGKQLTRNQIAYNQDIWNDQKDAYSPGQRDFNIWKNNAENTQQGFYNRAEYDKIVKKLNSLPAVGLENLQTGKANKRGKLKGSCATGDSMGGDCLKDINRDGGLVSYQQAGQVKYGTPEYREAYNKGEVITDKGVRSPILLDEVVIQNNYKRPRGIWEQYADKIVEENKDASLLGAIMGVPISAVASVPQLMGMKALTGKMQRPSEGLKIKNPYGAMAVDAVTDPAAWFGASEVAALKTLTRENALAKLANIRKIKTSAAPELTEGVSQQGFTWSMNPLGKVFGEKLPEGWHRKMGSGKGIQSVIDNQGIVSPSNDHLFFAYGKKPNENYAGVFNTVVDKSKLADSEISGFSTFYGPRGRHIGVSPVTSKGKSMTNIPITDPALSIHRRLPFTNSYIPIPKEAITSGPRTLKETLLVDPTLASLQKYGEDATKIALWLSAIQQTGHMGAGSNDKDKYPLGVPVLQKAYEASKAYVQPQLEKTADEFQKVLNSTQYTNGGLTKYQNAGAITSEERKPYNGYPPVNNIWLGNKLTKEGYITSTTKGGNYTSFTGNDRADDWINKQIDSGKFGFDPKTMSTFLLKTPVKGLSKKDQFIGSRTFYDLLARQGFTSESQDAQIKKLPEWQQDIINEENTRRRKRVVKDQMDEVYKSPLWYLPGAIATGGLGLLGLRAAGAAAAPYITTALATQLPGMAAVPGATFGNAITAGFAGHGLANVGPDTVEMYKNPSWSNAGSLGMDVLEVAPIVGPAAKTIGEGLRATGKTLSKLPSPRTIVASKMLNNSKINTKLANNLYNNRIIEEELVAPNLEFRGFSNKQLPEGKLIQIEGAHYKNIDGRMYWVEDTDKGIRLVDNTYDFMPRPDELYPSKYKLKWQKKYNVSDAKPNTINRYDTDLFDQTYTYPDDWIINNNKGQLSGNETWWLKSRPYKAFSERSLLNDKPFGRHLFTKQSELESFLGRPLDQHRELIGDVIKEGSVPRGGITITPTTEASLPQIEGLKTFTYNPITQSTERGIFMNPQISNVSIENAATEYANPIKDLAATFKNRNKKLITVGAENLDKELLKKITQLESPEGFNRLVAQEAEMLKRDFPGLVDLENKAISNAQTRISELYQTALRGNFNANYLEAKKLNPALTPQKFGIPRNNAFFRQGLGSSNFSDGVINLSKAESPAQLRNNIFAKEFYGIEMPGEIAIGREYAEGMPVYDHEINHLLQNSRNTALDDMLRKYFNNSQNLLKDFSQKTNKAYNYFRKSKHGVPSKEPSSFLAEARRAMLERGLIKDIYEPITPKKVFDAMKHFKTQPYENPYTGQSYHRIFDFASDSPQTLKFLSDSFNKLPAILPIGLTVGTGAAVLPTEKQGGTTSVKQKKALSWLSS